LSVIVLLGCGGAQVPPPRAGGGTVEGEAPPAGGEPASAPVASAPAAAPLVEADDQPAAPLGLAEAAWIGAAHGALHRPLLDIRRTLWFTDDPRYRDASLAVVLEIQVARDGKVQDAAFVKRSGLAFLDDAVVTLLTRLGTLPPPPAALQSDDGLTRLRWRVARQGHGCGLGEAAVVVARESLDDSLPRLVRAGKLPEAVARVRREIDAGGVPAEQAARLGRAVLAAALEELDGPGRAAAALALGQAGDPRAARVLEDLVRYRSEHTACAVQLLGALGARDAAPRLRALVTRNDGRLSVSAAAALKALGDPEAALPLVAELKASDPKRRLAALAAMAAAPHPKLHDALSAAALDSEADVRSAALRVLGALGGDAAAALLVKHARSESPPAHRAAAFEALAAMKARGRGLQTTAQDALRDRSARVRAAAFANYLRLAPAAALLEMRRALRDSDPAMLLAAVPVLADLGGGEAVAVLERILAKRSEPELKAAVAAALARVRGGRGGAAAPDTAATQRALDELAHARGAAAVTAAAKLLPVKFGCEAAKR
jgi:TonB family protein